MTKTSKEVQRLRAEAVEKDQQVRTSRTQADIFQKDLEKERAQIADLKNQLVKVATKCKTDEQVCDILW